MTRPYEEDWVYLDGRFCERAQAHLPMENRSVLFSDSVYEVTRYAAGQSYRMAEHLARLRRSMQAVQLPHPRELRELKQISDELVSRNGWEDATVYWQVMRVCDGPRRFQIPDGSRSLVFMTAEPVKPLDPSGDVPAWRAMLTEDLRWARCDIKSTMLLPASLAATDAKRRGCEGAVFYKQGHITEGFSYNIMGIKDRLILTHPANRQILGGITREAVLTLAQRLGYKIEARPIPLTKVDELDELLITSTTTMVTSIVQLDHHVFNEGKPGPAAVQLRKALIADMLA